MPRQARVVTVGAPHHITQRGNNRQDVFLLDEDRRTYLEFLRQDSSECGMRLLGYCLMTNHVHLVAIPRTGDAMARTLRRTHARYAQWFNRRRGRSGHLWQNRFFSCCLDHDHLVTALAYVDLNPVRAGLVGVPQDFPWSSARAHVEGSCSQGLLDIDSLAEVETRIDWSELLSVGVAPGEQGVLRDATRTGTPLGNTEFLRTIEQRVGRRLELRGRGRPIKTKAATV